MNIEFSDTVFGRLDTIESKIEKLSSDIARLMLILTCDRDDNDQIKLSAEWLEIGNTLESMNNDDDESLDTTISKAFDTAKSDDSDK